MGKWQGPGSGETTLASRPTRRAPLSTSGAKLRAPEIIEEVRPGAAPGTRRGPAYSCLAVSGELPIYRSVRICLPRDDAHPTCNATSPEPSAHAGPAVVPAAERLAMNRGCTR